MHSSQSDSDEDTDDSSPSNIEEEIQETDYTLSFVLFYFIVLIFLFYKLNALAQI